jgi:hypothetical protein
VSGEVGFAGVKLASLTDAHDFAGVCDRRGPVKALVECVAYEGAGRGVVAAYPCMYVPEELAPLGDWHASLQDAGSGALVQLAVDEGKRLAHPGDAPGLGPVQGEFPRAIQAIYLSRQSDLMGAGSTSITSASSAP